MSRPIGVSLIAALLLGLSLWAGYRALTLPGGQKNHPLVVTSLLLVALALVAAEALWSLRPHAFVAFVAWGLCGMVVLAHYRLRVPAGAHFGAIITGLVYAGLVFAAAAIYLRRAV
jgi:hypothetical protein